MIINNNREYALIMVTFMLSASIRILLDVYVYDEEPYHRDLFYELWMGNFVWDRYWGVIVLVLSINGAIWRYLINGDLKVLGYKSCEERRKGTICRRICGF